VFHWPGVTVPCLRSPKVASINGIPGEPSLQNLSCGYLKHSQIGNLGQEACWVSGVSPSQAPLLQDEPQDPILASRNHQENFRLVFQGDSQDQNRVWSRGYQVPDGSVQSTTRTCLKMAKAGPSAAWPQPFYQHTSVCKNTKLLTNWLQGHLHQYSLLLLDQSFNCLTPDLVILFTKSLTVSKVDQRIKHHSKTQIWTVLEGDTPGGRAWETIWKLILKEHLPNYELLVQCLAQVSS